jgi:riboflavin kinase/FMN adenylyltransferase
LFGENQLVPRKGVYRSVTAADGKVYNSITNIGVKPTVGDDIKPSAETHIIGYSGNLYGKNITVTLSEFVRDERKFNSVDELRTQIQNDINFVKTEKD